MKKKIIIILLLACMGITGCAAKQTEDEIHTETTENHKDESAVDKETGMDNETEEIMQQQSEQEDLVKDADSMIYQGEVLTREAEKDKVCIVVQPSVLRTYSSYYYTPGGEDQKWLQQFMDGLPSEGESGTGLQKGLTETGWQIAYQDKCYLVFEGGYMQCSYVDEKGEFVEYFVEAPKLCDYIQILLQEKLDYRSFDPADIENIVSAKLEICGPSVSQAYYSQTITDEDILKLFEEWFSNAEYIYGGAGCGNEHACLELTLADGELVRLSMAVDSCSNFGLNGVYYDYRPASVWDNREFFEQFDEIPWAGDEG